MFWTVLLIVTWTCWKRSRTQVQWASGSTFSDSLALQKIIKMWPVLVSLVGTVWEDAHLSDLNGFLLVIFADDQLSILEWCMLLVLWFKDFYVVVIIISIYFCSHTIQICCLYTCSKSFQVSSKLAFSLCPSVLISCLTHYLFSHCNSISCIGWIAFHWINAIKKSSIPSKKKKTYATVMQYNN